MLSRNEYQHSLYRVTIRPTAQTLLDVCWFTISMLRAFYMCICSTFYLLLFFTFIVYLMLLQLNNTRHFSRIFHPWDHVPHFPFLHFPPPQSWAAFSFPTFSTPAILHHIFFSCIFTPAILCRIFLSHIFHTLHFHCAAFSFIRIFSRPILKNKKYWAKT